MSTVAVSLRVVLLVGLLAGCGPVTVRVHGWPVERLANCVAQSSERVTCQNVVDIARDALDATGTATVYEMDMSDGNNVSFRSGSVGDWVVAFDEADGPLVIGVWCGVGIESDVCGVLEEPRF